MTLPLSHQQICDFFERSNEPFIFPYQEKGQSSLENYIPSHRNFNNVYEALWSITDALVHLRLNLIMPSQIRFSYVISNKGCWGLRHVICYGNSNEKTNQDAYDQQEQQYHQNAEHQLMWTLGKIILRFFTDKSIRIKFDSQKVITKVIEDHVHPKDIKNLAKRLLVWNCNERISFEQFLLDQFFRREGKSPYQSVVKHLRTLHNMEIDINKKRLNSLNLYNPFVNQVRTRCFLEYLQIDYYFQYVGNQIKEFFCKSSHDKAQCQFTIYTIALHSYFTMTQLCKQKILIGDKTQTIEQRLYYSRLVRRAVVLRTFLDKKAKQLRQNYVYEGTLTPFLKNLDLIQPEAVYQLFKSRIKKYAQVLSTLSQNLTMLKMLVHVYILRTSKYLFTEMRRQVFSPFLQNNQKVNLRQIFRTIINCRDAGILNKLLYNLKNFYLK